MQSLIPIEVPNVDVQCHKCKIWRSLGDGLTMPQARLSLQILREALGHKSDMKNVRDKYRYHWKDV